MVEQTSQEADSVGRFAKRPIGIKLSLCLLEIARSGCVTRYKQVLLPKDPVYKGNKLGYNRTQDKRTSYNSQQSPAPHRDLVTFGR
jgi:hypothetical protein